MTTDTQQTTEYTGPRPLLDKAFFGKDNCLTVQLRDGNCYCKWGKKTGGRWEWKTVKFSDVELGEILLVLEGDRAEASFYHSFNEESTQIWFSRKEDSLVCKAGDYVKGLSRGEQRVLRVLFQNAIWMMHVT